MKLQFLSLSKKQIERFSGLKTNRELQSHGPLNVGQEVPAHKHGEAALYRVDGLAEFNDGSIMRKTLGDGAHANAVLVPSGKEHGWRGLRPNTIIEHVFGDKLIQAVLA